MPRAAERRYVEDLKTWDLPRLEDLEESVTREFASRARLVFLNAAGTAGGPLHELFLDRLRDMARTAVNEILEYWLRGLADGSNGQFPEVCLELPYLERGEATDPLALAYCVDNEDGSRVELNRVPLSQVLGRIFDQVTPPDPARLRVFARALRELADTLQCERDRSGTIGQPSRATS
jgi:hypothetical protein